MHECLRDRNDFSGQLTGSVIMQSCISPQREIGGTVCSNGDGVGEGTWITSAKHKVLLKLLAPCN